MILLDTHTWLWLLHEPLSAVDAIASSLLPEPFNKDPADRILVAIARRYDIPFVSLDEKILSYPHVRGIW